ncbi:hypothetical protein BFJ63_vAg18338 [Fusarium oxysporum f. sp. narcissi]|uniref:Heterokaryon incompatibility domain-containing protein n=1 Tax=Fusarium oxysporum f. sp. narcissi TaxID=451672 RepID=A0A4Q2V1X1_FUSOX|nr:hypothetical protein BFJ63_vAg18338 [Fusarium oxysporum f. sp. narcissi]
MLDSFRLSDLSEQEFAYTSVPLPSPRHIRLLELFPINLGSANTESSKCRIYSTSLDSSPYFQAVSYVWGPNVRTTAVRVQTNHKPKEIQSDLEFSVLHVTSSVGEILNRFRSPLGLVTLWIDQICIDQSNNTEKSDQVRMMSEIYSRASQVLIWLGNPDNVYDSTRFMLKMEAVGNLARHMGIERMFHWHQRTDGEFWAFMNQVRGIKVSQKPSNVQFGEFSKKTYGILFGYEEDDMLLIASELMAIFCTRWFFRVWVVQEYVLARRATLIYGQNEIDAEKFALAITAIGLLNTNPQNLALQGANAWAQMFLCQAMDNDPIGNLWRLRKGHQNYLAGKESGYTFYELARDILGRHHHTLTATDPRDRVYAILSLAKDAQALSLSPDYSPNLSADQLYTQVARRMLHLNGGDLSVLELAQIPKRIMGQDSLAEKLPSWVPDFLGPEESISRPSRERPPGAWLYNPTGDTRQPQLLPTEDEKVLGLKGIQVDEIELVGGLWGDIYHLDEKVFPGLPSLNFDKIISYVAEVWEFCKRSHEKRFGGSKSDEFSWFETIWRVILGDVSADFNSSKSSSGV